MTFRRTDLLVRETHALRRSILGSEARDYIHNRMMAHDTNAKASMPKIAEFLRSQCPRTVADFKARFGEPRMDMANEAAREYSVWSVDGSPVLDIDYVMLYANVIKDQVLYVYARDGVITHISVVDPTDWRPSDFQSQFDRPSFSRGP